MIFRKKDKDWEEINLGPNPHGAIAERLKIRKIEQEVRKELREIESLHQLFISQN